MKTVVTKKLGNEVKEFVTKIIGEVLDDPDIGLNLTEEAKKQLKEARTYRGQNILASEIKKKYY